MDVRSIGTVSSVDSPKQAHNPEIISNSQPINYQSLIDNVANDLSVSDLMGQSATVSQAAEAESVKDILLRVESMLSDILASQGGVKPVGGIQSLISPLAALSSQLEPKVDASQAHQADHSQARQLGNGHQLSRTGPGDNYWSYQIPQTFSPMFPFGQGQNATNQMGQGSQAPAFKFDPNFNPNARFSHSTQQQAPQQHQNHQHLPSARQPNQLFQSSYVQPQSAARQSQPVMAQANQIHTDHAHTEAAPGIDNSANGNAIPKPAQYIERFFLGNKPVTIGGDGSSSAEEVTATKRSLQNMYQTSPLFKNMIDSSTDNAFELSVGHRPDNTSWGNADGRVFLNLNNVEPDNSDRFQGLVAHEFGHAAADLKHGAELDYFEEAVAQEAR